MTDPCILDHTLTPQDAEALFQLILRRPLDDDFFRDALVAEGFSLRRLIADLRASHELGQTMQAEWQRADRTALTDPVDFRVPPDLAVTPPDPARVLVIGSCLMDAFVTRLQAAHPATRFDLFLMGAELPAAPPHPVGEYAFQVIQLPLRSLLQDARFARLAQSDLAGHQALFDHALGMMRQLLHGALRWNRAHGLLSFVLPVLVPQQNPVGRLLPRYDLRNPVYFLERVNQELAQDIAARPNCHFMDLNELIATYGRRFVQDDAISHLNHGGLLSDFDYPHDTGRIEPPVRATEMYEEQLQTVVEAAWHELRAMYRSVRQIDMVKLVVIDLDDTLWRGTVAETAPEELPTTEGWPLGLWEALLFLKRRGMLLAIISKNEESRVRVVWPQILGQQLRLDDFAAIRINWRDKPENMAEILAQVNLLPANVVYIDDHPTQRGQMQAAFPDMRILSGNPLSWRPILLWSAETQVAEITAESARRTEMVQAQIVRETQRTQLEPADFRAGLDVRMTLCAITDTTHPRFARALELINKTNQFNTTGQRWTREACAEAFAAGTVFHAFDLADKHTAYGLVGVLIVDDFAIRQFVMSCRIMGLDAEIAAVAGIIDDFRSRGRRMLQAHIVETDRNLPCRELYARCGFRQTVGAWRRTTNPPLAVPGHIRVSVCQPAAA